MMVNDPPEGFEPCSPCINSSHGKIFGVESSPGPHWRVFIIIDDDGVERLGSTCKDGWGFMSCPNSPMNSQRLYHSEKYKLKLSTSLFPLMDVAEHFDTVFEETR